MDRFVETITNNNRDTLFDDYDAVMLLGVPEGESARRKANIQRYVLNDKFARHAKHKRVLVYHPIKTVDVDSLWLYLLENGMPWGTAFNELFEMYSSGGECPMTAADGKQAPICGGSSRNGCHTCLMVGKHGDKMRLNAINDGDNSLVPLLEWKQLLWDVRFDIKMRYPLRRQKLHKLSKPILDVGQLDLFGKDSWFSTTLRSVLLNGVWRK